MSVNLKSISTSEVTLSKGSNALTIYWACIQSSNWVNATIVSTENDSNIKTKWQRRVVESDGTVYLKVGFDNDSGKKVNGFVVVMADVESSSNPCSDDPSAVKVVVEED